MAAALAGVASFQACTVNNNNNPDNDGGEGNSGGTKNTGASSNSSGSSNEGGSTTEAGGWGPVGNEGGAASEGGATSEGGAASEGGATSEGGAASEGGAGQGGAMSCDDSVGEPTCDNISDICQGYCAAAVANLKPAAAVEAIKCLEADSTCSEGYECLTDATAKGCVDEDVTAACEAIVESCGEPGEEEPACDQVLSGLTDAVRTEVISCAVESCFSVYSCAEGFFFE